MIWRIAFREGCGLTLSLLMLRERNQLENRHQQMWALLPLLIKGLLSIISQFHSFLRLIILIHFTGINHESLLNRMIKLTHRPHSIAMLCSIGQRKASNFILYSSTTMLCNTGPRHKTDRCTTLRHVIQDLIDQGLVHLGQPSVTTNPLPFHTSHAIPRPPDDIHFMNFIEPDDHIHIMSWDDSKLEPTIVGERYEKVKFIHDGGVITVQSTEDTYSTSKPVLEISHSNDNLFPTGFTFDEIQTMEVKQFYKDYMAFPFYEHGSIVVLDMVRSMSFLSGLGLRRRQHGPGEFIVTVDHDTSFNLSFVPIKPDYRYMAFLHNERLRACMLHISFHYLVHPYRMSLTDAFREDHQWT
ncbi:hypothetical protein CK203_055836 [Vitis vinifera]|uniref:Uncharacterized protein n=1 Tax=Vitis vinifera TaxID=29760 RepID=A0A438H6A6_VITVI|nr:hypothetical protein CK203_055836 [Vitis vinifera]